MSYLRNKLENYKGLTLSNDEWLDQRINIKRNVKEAVLEDLQDFKYLKGAIIQLLVSANIEKRIVTDIKVMTKSHLQNKMRIFGDFEK